MKVHLTFQLMLQTKAVEDPMLLVSGEQCLTTLTMELLVMLNKPPLLEVKMKLLKEPLCSMDFTTKPPPLPTFYVKDKVDELLF